MLHWILDHPLGAVVVLFLVYIVTKRLTKMIFDSWLLLGLLILIAFVLIKNIHGLGGVPSLPVVGTPLSLAKIGVQSDQGYRSCLYGYVTAEPGNPGLQAAAGACETKRSSRFWACMAEVKDDLLILDKEAHCIADAGKVWTPCTESALSTYASTNTPVQNCAQGKTIDILRNVAGSQRGPTP
jgi:hypothetical protein